MKLTPKIEKALITAAVLHRDQERKDGGFPYIIHPYSVAIILSQYIEDEDVISAGLLHDTVEDCGYTPKRLKKEFGERVCRIVLEVSEDVSLKDKLGEEASWEERKRKYLDHMMVASQEAMLVCAADKIHNLKSLLSAFDSEGKAIFEKFNSPVDRKFWFYGECLRILDERLHSGIVSELEKVYLQAKKTILV